MNEQLQEALQRISDWCEAYPTSVFMPLSKDEETTCVKAMEAAVSNGSSRMHATWARHLLEGIGEIARTALDSNLDPKGREPEDV